MFSVSTTGLWIDVSTRHTFSLVFDASDFKVPSKLLHWDEMAIIHHITIWIYQHSRRL